MRNETFTASESIWEIIDFYRIQPRIEPVQLEKIEEYLVLVNAHHQNYQTELDEIINSNDEICLIDVIDILNSYLNIIEEELEKIFPDNNENFEPILIHSGTVLHEVQSIDLLRKYNQKSNGEYEISEKLNELETILYEADFKESFAQITKSLMRKINAKIVVKVEELI